MVLMARYTRAPTASAAMCAAAPGSPWYCSHGPIISNNEPPIAIAAGAAARLAMRLLKRDEVRTAPIRHSTLAANAAGAVPYIASNRKITVSQVAIEYMERGMWIGNAAAIAV